MDTYGMGTGGTLAVAQEEQTSRQTTGETVACESSGDEQPAEEVEAEREDEAAGDAPEGEGEVVPLPGCAPAFVRDPEDYPFDEDIRHLDIDNPHELGIIGEAVARKYLWMRGYDIVERNWRTPYGEADVVACDHGQVGLVEVKTRRGEEACPEEAVDAAKLSRYRKMVLQYLREHLDATSVRVDVLGINVTMPGKAHLRHIVGVSGWDD